MELLWLGDDAHKNRSVSRSRIHHNYQPQTNRQSRSHHNYLPQTNRPTPHPSQLSPLNQSPTSHPSQLSTTNQSPHPHIHHKHQPLSQSLHLYSPLKKRIRISLICLTFLANAIRQISDIRISISIGLGAIGQTRMLRPRLCIGALRRGGGRGALLLYRHDKSTAGGEVHLELAVLGDSNLAAFVVFCRTVGIDAVVERVGLATGDVER